MPQHEEKKCKRCNASFTCKVGDITNCQCYGIELTADEEAYIAGKYDDCLCSKCLLELRNRYHLFIERKEIYGTR